MRAFFQNERQPLYIQLKEAIKDEIIKGNLKAGDKIHSEILLQRLYSVSRVTVRKAVNELVKENYLIKLQGKGTYVSQVFVFEGRKGISSFTELCKLQGKATIAVVIKADLERGTKEQCDFFKMKKDSWIMHIARVRKVDGVPVVLEDSYYAPFYEFLKQEDLAGSIYELLRNKYKIYPVKRGLNEVGIINAGQREEEFLGIKRGVPVLRNKVQIYDSDNQPVHEVQQIVRVDRPEIFKYYIE